MGEIMAIDGDGPEVAALQFLKRFAEKIGSGEIKPEGIAIAYYLNGGLVDCMTQECLGDEQVVGLFEIAKALIVQEYLDYDDD